MTLTTTEAARRWSRAWEEGWEALDPEPILACYAPNALLSSEPFREPYRGIDGVRDYVTRVLGAEEDPHVWMAEPIVHGDRAAISWWTSLLEEGAPATLAGTSILRFDETGLVLEQWDAWNVAAERRAPPGWSPFQVRDSRPVA
jgi:hypothetical protein